MSASKRMFNEMREQEMEDQYVDDAYLFEQWMGSLKDKTNHNSNSATDVLEDLFKTFGEIFCPQNQKQNERESV
tara:strand:+ start:1896 stop:2117 length:222 start_codon:yes stop_codon:yes gene_type:complete